MIADSVVANRIIEKHGGLDATSDIYKLAERVTNAKKTMTKPPRQIKLTGVDSYAQFGCCAEFITLYNQKIVSAPMETCVNIMGHDIACDREVYAALSALGFSSIHAERERAEAAATLFKRVFVSAKDGALTKAKLYEIVQSYKKTNDYYIGEFIKALDVCVFSANEASLYWQSMIDTMGYYNDAVKEGIAWIEESKIDKKSLETLLKSNYARAKEDKEFMKTVYKPAANKWMIGMLYILHDEHPAVINPKHAGADGFM